MKVKITPSKTKWGKKMEKSIPKEALEFYTKILIESITNKKVEIVR